MTISKKQISIIYKSLGLTIVAILVINLLSFLFKLFQVNQGSAMSVKFKHGLFIINGETSGLNYSESKYWVFYIVVFVICFFYYKRKYLLAK